MKTHINLSLDPELAEKVKKLGINVSGLCNDFLWEEVKEKEGYYKNYRCQQCTMCIAPKSAWTKWRLICPNCKRNLTWNDLKEVEEGQAQQQKLDEVTENGVKRQFY